MLLTIGTAASPGGSLQIRIGPVSSFIYVYTGQPIVLVKGATTLPSSVSGTPAGLTQPIFAALS